MDGLLNNFGNFNSHMNFASLFKNSDISPPIQQHLSKVYGSLVLCILAAMAGVSAHVRYGIGDGSLAMLVSPTSSVIFR